MKTGGIEDAFVPLPTLWLEFRPFCVGIFWLTFFIWFTRPKGKEE